MRNPLKLASEFIRSGIRAFTPAYNSTGFGNALRDWNASSAAINSLVQHGGDLLRRQTRDMVRRNSWASNAVDSYVANAIGAGIVPQSKHPDPKVKESIQSLWLRWTDEADAAGLTDFYGLESLACRGAIEGGECFAQLVPQSPDSGMTVPLKIRLIEPEQLPLTDGRDLPNGNKVRMGIEYGAGLVRQAYHFYREHPGELPVFYQAREQVAVAAKYILHLFKPVRIGQQRGQPWLTGVLLALYELEKFDRAVLVKQAISTMVVFFERDLDGSGGPGVFGRSGEQNSSGVPIQGMEPGAYIKTPSNRMVEHSKPPDVGTAYSEFMRAQLRKVAGGIGITYEQLSGDLSGVNYSSIRAGLLEFRRRCEAFQHQVMVFQFCRPVWRAWIEAAALAGKIDASDYARNPEFYLDVDWTPPAWPWVDPLKDIEAELLEIDNLLKARSQSMKERGRDPEEVDQMRVADQQREDTLKLRRGPKAEASPTLQNSQKEQAL